MEWVGVPRVARPGERLADVPLDALRGALWLRGFDADAFEAYTERFGGTFAVHQSLGRRLVTADGTTQTVAPGQHALPLHRERAYSPIPPDLLFFRCVRPAAAGGETTLCDGVALARALPASARAALDGRRFRYVSWSSPAEWARAGRPDLRRLVDPAADIADFAFALEGGRIRLEHTAPCVGTVGGEPCLATFLLYYALHDEGWEGRLSMTFEDGDVIPRALAEDVAAAAEALTQEVAWEPGDVLVVDNRRVMHGRRPFADEGRELHLRMLHRGAVSGGSPG